MSALPKSKEQGAQGEKRGDDPQVYNVTALEKCKLDPEGPNGYRYIIEGGYAPITGFRTGSREKVLQHASELAKEMNNRRGVKGTKHIVIGKPKGTG
jgi:hypothetical protein